MRNEWEKQIIALEGPVCAGKTTLAKGLACIGYRTILEYVDYATTNKLQLPKFPPKDETNAKSNFEFYLDLERRRQSGMGEGLLLLDRSTYTLLAFEAGARLITQIDIFEWSCNLVEQRKSEIVQPSHVIYIDIPPIESRKRASLAKMGTPDFLFSSEFTGGFKDAFKIFETKNPDRFTFVDGCRPYEAVLSEISARICSKAGVSPKPASILK